MLEAFARNEEGGLQLAASVEIVQLLGGDRENYGIISGSDDRVFLHAWDLQKSAIFEVLWDGDVIRIEVISDGHPPILIPGEVIVPDLDADGFGDLVVTVPGNDGIIGQVKSHIFWSRGKSGDSFESEKRRVTDPASGFLVSFAGDINNDGMVDLVGYRPKDGPTASTDLVILKNRNNGAEFESVPFVSEFEFGGYRLHEIVDITPANDGVEGPGMWPEGLKDFIVTQSVPVDGLDGVFETKVLILHQDEDENFTPIELFSSWDSIHQLDLVDWDGDGIDDLFYVTYPQDFGGNGSVHWRKGESRAFRFADWGRQLLELDGTGLFGPPVDFDNDGDLDLELYLNWLPTPGKSLWAVTGPNHTIDDLQFVERSQPRSIREFFPNGRTRLFDFDDDGDLDVLYSAHTYRIIGYQRLEWFENKGEAGYEPRLSEDGAPTPRGNLIDSVRIAERNSFVMADLNGDGTKDLIVGSFPPRARLEWFPIEKASQPAVYETWAIDSSITGHSAAPEADWDGDTVSNWEEFVFGSNPAAVDQDHSGRPHIQSDSSGVSFVFQRRADFENLGLSYRPLMSEDLKSWSLWGEVSPRVSPFDDDYEIVTFPVPPTLDRAFFKLIPPGLVRK